MITEEQVRTIVNEYLHDTDYELQTLQIDKDQNILIEVDRLGIVDVDWCAALNKYIVDHLNPDDNYSIEVGSVSLTDPFKSRIQYQKHLGHNVVVTDKEDKRYSGQLISVDEDTFQIEAEETLTFRYDEVKRTVYNITF